MNNKLKNALVVVATIFVLTLGVDYAQAALSGWIVETFVVSYEQPKLIK